MAVQVPLIPLHPKAIPIRIKQRLSMLVSTLAPSSLLIDSIAPDTASPDDPNEISFTKGEILDIVDKQGKWWQARKADGTLGSTSIVDLPAQHDLTAISSSRPIQLSPNHLMSLHTTLYLHIQRPLSSASSIMLRRARTFHPYRQVVDAVDFALPLFHLLLSYFVYSIS